MACNFCIEETFASDEGIKNIFLLPESFAGFFYSSGVVLRKCQCQKLPVGIAFRIINPAGGNANALKQVFAVFFVVLVAPFIG